MLSITQHPEGCILSVWAQPGARREGVLGEHGGALKVAVSAPPEQGKANKALMQILRDVLGLKRSQLELVSGETSREKRFLIRGVTGPQLVDRLTSLLDDASSR
jgi:uncharacterized protein (TIGR00251 family)